MSGEITRDEWRAELERLGDESLRIPALDGRRAAGKLKVAQNGLPQPIVDAIRYYGGQGDGRRQGTQGTSLSNAVIAEAVGKHFGVTVTKDQVKHYRRGGKG